MAIPNALGQLARFIKVGIHSGHVCFCILNGDSASGFDGQSGTEADQDEAGDAIHASPDSDVGDPPGDRA